MIETLTAFSLLLMIIMSTLPVLSELRVAQKHLYIERQIITHLHDEIYEISQSERTFPFKETHHIGTNVELTFVKETGNLKGCANWKNHRNEAKEFCLYGANDE